MESEILGIMAGAAGDFGSETWTDRLETESWRLVFIILDQVELLFIVLAGYSVGGRVKS